jgi:hypothetical protein
MFRFKPRSLLFATAAAALLLCILAGTGFGGGESEKLLKELKSVIESQLPGMCNPEHRHYTCFITVEEWYCVPNEMTVPETFRKNLQELDKEPHKTRYKLKKVFGRCNGPCLGLGFRIKPGSYSILTSSENEAHVLVTGLMLVTTAQRSYKKGEKLPKGCKFFAAQNGLSFFRAVPRDSFAHIAAMFSCGNLKCMKNLTDGWNSVWQARPGKGRQFLEEILKESKDLTEKAAKWGAVPKAFDAWKPGDDPEKMVGKFRKGGEKLSIVESVAGSGIITERWQDQETNTYNVNGLAQVECLVKLKRNPETKKWKVEKMWLLSELEVPRKAK